MLRDDDQIGPGQALAVIGTFTLGLNAAVLPRLAARAGADAWLAFLAATLAGMAAALLLGAVTRRFPNQTFVEYGSSLLGPFLGRLVAGLLVLFWLLILSVAVRQFGDIVKLYLLQRTPLEVVLLSLLFVAGYAARGGIEPLARANQIALPAVMLPALATFLATLFSADWTRFLPVLDKGVAPLLRPTLDLAVQYAGLESLLVYGAFMDQPRAGTRVAFWAVLLTFLLGTATILGTIGNMGATETSRLLWPSLALLGAVQLPSLFLERVTGVILALWTALIAGATAVGLNLIGTTLARLSGQRGARIYIFPATLAVFLLAILPINVTQAMAWMRALVPFTAAVLWGLPSLFLLLAGRRRGKSA